jgi:hypothetical protein
VTEDDKDIASAFRKRNRDERSGQPSLRFDGVAHVHEYAKESENFVAIAEDTPADVRRKKDAYEKARQKPDWWHDWVACNIWTAAFFLPLAKHDDPTVPTHDRLLNFVQRQDSQPQMAATANALAEQLRFFHWRLEFPEVFENGGFDAVVGNPPWDTLSPDAKEFFSNYDPHVRTLAPRQQEARIRELCESPAIAADVLFVRNAGGVTTA